MKQLEDPDSDKATEAAKVLAEMVQKEGNETKEQILRQGLFAFLWKSAKQGRLTWEDKWYATIDSSKLSFKDELGVGAFAIVYKGTYKNKGKKEDVAIKAMDENLINLPDLRCELATMRFAVNFGLFIYLHIHPWRLNDDGLLGGIPEDLNIS
jgi:hypothetical protein